MASSSQAAGPNESQVQSSFPLPPMTLIEKYTDDAVMRGTAPKPPPPIKDSYMMFGLPCQEDDLIIRPLEMQGLKRLHPQIYDRRKELKKLTVSILCNFLDLLDILVNATGSQARDEKIEDLNLLFIHIHHLINEFRPHQARETLKVMMEMQQAQMLDVGERLWKHIERAGKILSNCSAQIATMQKKVSAASRDTGLMHVKEEAMNVEALINSTIGTDGNLMGDLPQSDMDVEMDEASIVKNIFEKDRILAGLIDEIEE